MFRRRSLAVSAATLIAVLSLLYQTGCTSSSEKQIDTHLAGRESQWTFVGSEHPWRQKGDGVILSPTWAVLGNRGYGSYADSLTREDYAFPSHQALSNTDLSVDFQIRYGSVTDIGVGFRAQDSVRMYCVTVGDIDSRKANAFKVSLWMQDADGFRQKLASGVVPHPRARFAESPRTYEQWEQSSPGWSTLRVRAVGPHIKVWVRGQKAIDTRDSTYAAGTVALIARWAVLFRNLKISGTPAKLSEPWHVVPGKWPKYVEPFDGRLGDYEVFPAVTQDAKGTLYVIANVAPTAGWNKNDLAIGIVKSMDGGKTWIDPQKFEHLGKFIPLGAGNSPSLYFHKDGHVTCFYRDRPSIPKGATVEELESAPEFIGWSNSRDGGRTWSKTHELIVSGKPVSKTVPKGSIFLYSPVQRLRTDTLLLTAYYSPDGKTSCSTIFRSTDDGNHWTGPYFIGKDKMDTSECMIAESGKQLLAFTRTVKSPLMWTSRSTNDGAAWSPIETTNIVAADCPFLLNLSSGAVVMGYRGWGIYTKVSHDGGKNWGPPIRIASASGMMGMTELKDGQILVVYHTGYRAPGRIRAQFIRVKGDGVVSAWN